MILVFPKSKRDSVNPLKQSYCSQIVLRKAPVNKKLLINNSTCNYSLPSLGKELTLNSFFIHRLRCFMSSSPYTKHVVVSQVCVGILWGCQEGRYRTRTSLHPASGPNPPLLDMAGRSLTHTYTLTHVLHCMFTLIMSVCVCVCVWVAYPARCLCLFICSKPQTGVSVLLTAT